jgi:hypothetical protein
MTEGTDVATGTTLYYPYIHPRKINHLKAALLYWDRVRRIVPRPVLSGGHVYDDNDDARLLAAHDLLIATQPESYSERAAKRFFRHLEPHSERFRIDIDTARELASRNRGIHIEKLGDEVLGRLHQLGLAHQFGEWAYLHDEVGAFYMFCLASEMSGSMGSPLFTDSPDDAVLGQSLLFEPEERSNVTNTLLRVGIQLPSPEALQNVSVGTIVQFAVRRAAERQQFREAVEGIVNTASSISDANALEDYLATHRTKINEAVGDLRAALDELSVGAFSSVAKITIPAGAAAAIAAFPISAAAAAILGATGLAISAISCYAETRGKLRQARTSSPYHYLISLQNELGIDTQ